jgi:hypothetical protein
MDDPAQVGATWDRAVVDPRSLLADVARIRIVDGRVRR